LLAPEPEAPARLAKQIYRVLQGLAAIVGSGEPTEQDYNLIYRLALDCIPKIRTQCLELLNNSGELETPKVASEIAYPTSTTRLSLEELHRMGLVAVVKEGHGKADRWSLSDLACQLLEDCAPEVIESKTG